MGDVTFDVSVIQLVQLFVLPVLLPILVGLVTTRVTDSGKKATLLLALSVVSALITEWVNAAVNNVSYNLGQGLLLAFITFVTGVALHYGLLKPTGVSDAAARHGVTEK